MRKSQLNQQTLYNSRKGLYYLEHRSDRQGSRARVEWVSREEAARWLIQNNKELPEDLADLADEVERQLDKEVNAEKSP